MIGYHASHEQYKPSELLEYVALAEQAGFQGVMSSDHTAPWSVTQGESGYCWSWLGAALAKTNLPFGSLSIPIDFRYHPLIVAQAAATLSEMFPHRFPWIAVGSGEALNEVMVGKGWPEKQERNQRLFEAVEIMRKLWRGETVTKSEGIIKAEQAKLWTLPSKIPKIIGAALTPETAHRMGGFTDGLITVRMPDNDLKDMISAFHDGGGRGKRLVLQMQIVWAEDYNKALSIAFDQWKCVTISPQDKSMLRTTADFDEKTKSVTPADVEKTMLISAKADDFIENIARYQSMGFDEIYIHNACRNQKDFIDFFGKNVLPYVHRGKQAEE